MYKSDVFSKQDWRKIAILSVVWLVFFVEFWRWWIMPNHWVGIASWLNSFVILWLTALPGYFLWFVLKAKKPNEALPAPQGRYAMVVTKAPSEPWPMLQTTLTAMLAQKFDQPFDVWLATEKMANVDVEWCRRHGVQISCRDGAPEKFQNPVFPGRAKSKEGNLYYWYVKTAYDRYDFVAQFDADHVPAENYLSEVARGFADSTVGYVACPSICDANASHTWTGRARLFVEATLHGILQSGYYGAGIAPLCIGSHYAVRVKAVKSLQHKEYFGGLGPELAEDHSTSLAMQSAGWRGAFAINAIAHGDGPESFGEGMVQEYQWARSLVNLLIQWTPWYFAQDGMSLKLKLQFGFAQLWYPLYAITMLLAFLMPVFALVFDEPFHNVDLVPFFARITAMDVTLLSVLWIIKRAGYLRPVDAPIISWESVLFQLTRWPWVLYACMHGVVGSISKKQFNFKVTAKATNDFKPLPISMMIFYIVLALVYALSLMFTNPQIAKGYRLFGIINYGFYAIVAISLVALHLWEGSTRMDTTGIRKVLKMRLYGFSSVFVFFSVLIGAFLSMPQPSLAQGQFTWGAYDPNNTLLSAVQAEEAFIPWRYQNTSEVEDFLSKAATDKKIPVLTLEPWSWGGWNDMSDTTLLEDIATGKYDSTITDTCGILDSYNGPIFLRFMHEMDLNQSYPWQGSPRRTIPAYRHFVSTCRALASNIVFIWSPAGDPSLVNHYPGAEYVDMIGLTILEFPTWNQNYYGKKFMSFDELFAYRYDWVKGFGKPIIVAELAVAWSPDYQTQWLADAMNSFSKYPLLEGAIYFNNGLPNWHPDPERPHWPISLEQFQEAQTRAAN